MASLLQSDRREGSLALRSDIRIPALDGVRGLAILMVMLYHFSCCYPHSADSTTSGIFRLLHLGWAGVDFFFVLSGFLITGILLDSKGSNNYFKNFYMRRILRIFPLYFGTLFFLFYILPFFAQFAQLPPWMQTFSDPAETRYQFSLWTYTFNIALAANGWAWPLLTPYWSLSVEEQFYLLWPPLVYLIDRKHMMRACVGLILAAICLRTLLAAAQFPPEQYALLSVLTPIRMDSLAVGALLALAARMWGMRTTASRARFLSVAGLVGILCLCFVSVGAGGLQSGNGLFVYAVGFSAIPMFYGGLLIAALSPAAIIGRIFSTRVLRLLGKYSYAIYILHIFVLNQLVSMGLPQTIRLVVRSELLGALLYLVLLILVTVIAAVLSWHCCEKHFLKLKKYFDYSVSARSPT
jgi:peptidoglycan/LPS O-acetylase OafA/YrhL